MILLFACAAEPLPVDQDGDGWPPGPDCDDQDPARHPGAEEVCGNRIDDDCDLVAPACGLYGAVPLGTPDVRGPPGLGAVLVGGATPAATAPGVGVYLLDEARWLPAPDLGFGAALATGPGGLLIGDPEAGTVSGAVTLMGPADVGFGAAIAWVGADVAVGAPNARTTFLFQPDGTAIAQLTGDSPGAGAGLAGADLDGDGVEDLAVAGLPAQEGDGRVWALLGPIVGDRALGDADTIKNAAEFELADGAALLGPCERDGDGLPDLILSSYETGDGLFLVNVTWLHGADLEAWAVLSASAEAPIHPACGDLDGDGVDEIALPDRGWVEINDEAFDRVGYVGVPRGGTITTAFVSDPPGLVSAAPARIGAPPRRPSSAAGA